jgi:hypothetical protein
VSDPVQLSLLSDALLSDREEAVQAVAELRSEADGHEFLDTSAGLFSAPQESLPGLDIENRRPGSSLFAWRDLFRS